jgi:hypothetical protein
MVAALVVVTLGACGAPPEPEARPAPLPIDGSTSPTTGPAPESTTSTSSAVVAATSAVAAATAERWDNLEVTHAPGIVPVRLVVDALGIDAAIGPAGVEPDGALELPADTTTIAWYASGAAPGEAGSALLAAHVDHDGRAGVFFRLRELDRGAEIRVVAADGRLRTFVVDGRPIEIDKSALRGEPLFGTDGPATLALVTCGGPFDRSTRSYERNTIVFAREVTAAAAPS